MPALRPKLKVIKKWRWFGLCENNPLLCGVIPVYLTAKCRGLLRKWKLSGIIVPEIPFQWSLYSLPHIICFQIVYLRVTEWDIFFPQTSSVLTEAIQECCADCDPIQTYLGVKPYWIKHRLTRSTYSAVQFAVQRSYMQKKWKEVLILEGSGMIVEQKMLLHSS